jgi:hypothetical protein
MLDYLTGIIDGVAMLQNSAALAFSGFCKPHAANDMRQHH